MYLGAKFSAVATSVAPSGAAAFSYFIVEVTVCGFALDVHWSAGELHVIFAAAFLFRCSQESAAGTNGAALWAVSESISLVAFLGSRWLVAPILFGTSSSAVLSRWWHGDMFWNIVQVELFWDFGFAVVVTSHLMSQQSFQDLGSGPCGASAVFRRERGRVCLC